ncbi:hypothetical protein AXK56_16415 [Tsukamurella pulmonis]|uniref:Mce-associated membrane protein n=1 Tax=Tsukamurella pulmonis TaxID=47312 RepID=A0A1H1A7S0_9ACTN|nr:hypothetical protein [Tsukamurella pulmonis]KXO95795.1 hypothetical protein AXK56_16415 [Tsukamurella pulmonis]SDQ35758.1 Mce-associated membrane protein [Tsukamurella pulmonis]SUQ39442.1 Uncharacterised protein [Tsukamurella pulmonis]
MTRSTAAAKALFVVVLAGLLAIAGCSDEGAKPANPSQSEHYEPGDSGLPAGTPSTVFSEALTSLFTWEPVTQSSPTDALVAAKKYLTGKALADAESPARVRTSADWSAWRANQDIVTAVVGEPQIVEHPDGTASARATLTQIVQHLDGTTTPYTRYTASAQLLRVGPTWKLSTYPDLNV